MLFAVPILLLLAFFYSHLPFAHSLPCAIKFGLDIPCPGCSMTEAVSLALHGRLADSISLHPLGPVLIVWLLVLWLNVFLKKLANRGARYEKFSRRLAFFSRGFSFAFVAALILFWVYKLVRAI